MRFKLKTGADFPDVMSGCQCYCAGRSERTDAWRKQLKNLPAYRTDLEAMVVN